VCLTDSRFKKASGFGNSDGRRREQEIPRCAPNDEDLAERYFLASCGNVQRSFVGSPRLRPSTPPPQDDIWGWEDSTATQDDSRGRPSSIWGVTLGGLAYGHRWSCPSGISAGSGMAATLASYGSDYGRNGGGGRGSYEEIRQRMYDNPPGSPWWSACKIELDIRNGEQIAAALSATSHVLEKLRGSTQHFEQLAETLHESTKEVLDMLAGTKEAGRRLEIAVYVTIGITLVQLFNLIFEVFRKR
jgi:hypothetical protein